MSHIYEDPSLFQNITYDKNDSSSNINTENYNQLFDKLDKKGTLNSFERHIMNKLSHHNIPLKPLHHDSHSSPHELVGFKSRISIETSPNTHSSESNDDSLYDRVQEKGRSDPAIVDNVTLNTYNELTSDSNILQPLIKKIDLRTTFKKQLSPVNSKVSPTSFSRFKKTFPIKSYNISEIKAKYEKNQAYISSRRILNSRIEVDYESHAKLNSKNNYSLISINRSDANPNPNVDTSANANVDADTSANANANANANAIANGIANANADENADANVDADEMNNYLSKWEIPLDVFSFIISMIILLLDR